MAIFDTNDRYTLIKKLGKGGMGIVYQVRDTQLDRDVAAKVMNASDVEEEDVTRFLREAQSMARLNHPGICPIFDYGTDDGQPYFIMQLIEGHSLDQVLETQWPLPAKIVAKWVKQVAQALVYAHAKNVWHRDLKLENIMINEQNDAILMDFGLAKDVEASVSLTQTGGFMGTPAFAPPEQFSDVKRVDHRADIYSLGLVLYVLLCKSLPYHGDLFSIFGQKQNAIMKPSELCPDGALDANLEAICLKASQVKVEDRYQTIEEFSQDLADYLNPKPIPKPPTTITGETVFVPNPHVPKTPAIAVAPFDAQAARQFQKEWAASLGLDRVWENSIGMKMVVIPPGQFLMGSPIDERGRYSNENQVEVKLTKPFSLGQAVVTQRQWENVRGTTPWKGKYDVKLGPEYPAIFVNWKDAIDFCQQLTQKDRKAEKLPQGWSYTLPTEAQWEYVCRAGTTTQFSFGEDESQLKDHAWFFDTASDVGECFAHEVAKKFPNPFGLYDIHGNVWEWCRDWYQDDLPGGTNPEVTTMVTNRVNRGGSWLITGRYCRSANRNNYSPGSRYDDLGFRVAAVQDVEATS